MSCVCSVIENRSHQSVVFVLYNNELRFLDDDVSYASVLKEILEENQLKCKIELTIQIAYEVQSGYLH